MVRSADSSLVLPPLRKKSRRAASVSDRLFHASGLRAWTRVSAPMSFLGRLSELVANSLRRGVCVLKPSRLAAAVPDGKIVLVLSASFLIAVGLGRLGPKAVERGR
jgi:hypothetical protein